MKRPDGPAEWRILPARTAQIPATATGYVANARLPNMTVVSRAWNCDPNHMGFGSRIGMRCQRALSQALNFNASNGLQTSTLARQQRSPNHRL
jgi:hypothetical protein